MTPKLLIDILYLLGLVIRPRSDLLAGKLSAIFLPIIMKELSVFVDESGDFGNNSSYYIVIDEDDMSIISQGYE